MGQDVWEARHFGDAYRLYLDGFRVDLSYVFYGGERPCLTFSGIDSKGNHLETFLRVYGGTRPSFFDVIEKIH